MTKDTSNVPQTDLPLYKCYKEVRALKIAKVVTRPPVLRNVIFVPGVDPTTLIPEDNRYGPIEVSEEYMAKHKPKPGGYYVVYKDGYKSFSPAEAFEEGYTLVE